MQLSWSLEDEKKFASQRGGESSRKEDQLVSKYKRSWCIQVLHSRMSREMSCREQMKRVRARDKGLFRRQLGMGQLWGDWVTSMTTLFHCLSASPWTVGLLFIMTAVRPLWILGRHWSLAQKDWSITSWSSSVPLRWMVMPQGHSQSPHTSRISRANLSPSLSNSTMYHVLWSIPCPLLTSPSKASNTQCQLKPMPSRLRGQYWGLVLKLELAGTLGLLLGGACCMQAKSHHCRCCWALWLGQCLPQNQLHENKGPSGHWSSWNKCGDATPCWHGGSHKERGTLRPSVFRELQCNLSAFGAWTWMTAQAVPEIGCVTSRMAGDNPSVMSHHKLTVSLPFSKFSCFGW